MSHLHAALSGMTAWSILDNGVEIQSGEWHNLITNLGLDFFGSKPMGHSTFPSDKSTPAYSGFRNALAVGTGSAAPAFTDVALGAEVYRANTSGGFDSENDLTFTIDNAAQTITCVSKLVRLVNIGQAQNLTEYGFSPDSSFNTGNMSIRELFRDANGTPIVLSLTAGQQLKVSHTLTVVLPWKLEDAAFSISNLGTLNGKMAFFMNNSGYEQYMFNRCFGPQGDYPPSFAVMTTADTGTTTNTGTPSGVTVNATRLPYVNGSYERNFTATMTTAQGNGTIYGFLMLGYATQNGHKFRLTSPASFVKDNSQALTINWRVTWGRA